MQTSDSFNLGSSTNGAESLASFERGSWQHAVDDELVNFGRTSQSFATPHEAVKWLLEIERDVPLACLSVTPECRESGCAAARNTGERDADERFSGNNEVRAQVKQQGWSSPSLDRPQSLSSAIGSDGVDMPAATFTDAEARRMADELWLDLKDARAALRYAEALLRARGVKGDERG